MFLYKNKSGYTSKNSLCLFFFRILPATICPSSNNIAQFSSYGKHKKTAAVYPLLNRFMAAVPPFSMMATQASAALATT